MAAKDVTGFFFSIGLIVGAILVWRYNVGERAYQWLKGGIMARAKAQTKMHYRVGEAWGGQPLARCGKRVVSGRITTARGRVTCGTCISAMKRDQLRVKGKSR